MANHRDSNDLRNIVAETTAQIVHYQSLIEKLLAQRERTQLQLDALVYPVLKIPPEITSEVFYQCLPAPHHWNSADPGKAPMLLSHVCRAWREIALSTPALWAEVEFGLVRGRRRAHVLETWLSRAGSIPLSIRLNIWDLKQGDTASDVFETFARHSYKIQSLNLGIRWRRLQDMEKARYRWSFPLLQVLDLHGDRFQDEPSLEIFSDCPLLREVSLSAFPASSISLPWQQLTKFTGRLCTVANCLEILCLIPNLRECTFTNCAQDEESPDLPVLSHSNLQSLTIEDEGEFINGLVMLKFLSLPALQTFVLQFSGWIDMQEFDGIFSSFLSRCSPPLGKFSFRPSHQFTDFDTARLFHMPKLFDLQIWNPSSHFISNFTDSFMNADTNFLPQLQHLTFRSCRATMLKLSHGLSARWHARDQAEFARLETVRLEFWSDMDFTEDALLPFQKLLADGMDICINERNIGRDSITVVGK
ncbi:hypothetical protein B0H17DRAFT_970277, partial [Mycena rosella]